MIKVGIVGCGFVGGALKAWLEEDNPEVKVFVSGPPLHELNVHFRGVEEHI